MIRNRQFMFGLGIGLIAGALLLQFMMIGQMQTGKLKTKEQVEQAAAALQLKVVPADQQLLTEDEWRAKAEEEGSGQTTEGNPNTPDTPVTPESPQNTEEPDPGSVPESSAPSNPDQPVNEPVSVKYKIVAGSTLTGVAEGLLQAGVINDKDAFLKRAKDKKINYKVRTGTFTFEIGEDYDSIIGKISPGSAKSK